MFLFKLYVSSTWSFFVYNFPILFSFFHCFEIVLDSLSICLSFKSEMYLWMETVKNIQNVYTCIVWGGSNAVVYTSKIEPIVQLSIYLVYLGKMLIRILSIHWSVFLHFYCHSIPLFAYKWIDNIKWNVGIKLSIAHRWGKLSNNFLK